MNIFNQFINIYTLLGRNTITCSSKSVQFNEWNKNCSEWLIEWVINPIPKTHEINLWIVLVNSLIDLNITFSSKQVKFSEWVKNCSERFSNWASHQASSYNKWDEFVNLFGRFIDILYTYAMFIRNKITFSSKTVHFTELTVLNDSVIERVIKPIPVTHEIMGGLGADSLK